MRQILHLSFDQDSLWISSKNQELSWDRAVPGVSLRRLLEAGAFFNGNETCTYTKTDKYLLVLNLARWFFYLYDGPWGPCDWSVDRIFFLNEPGADAIEGRLTPYICCHLPNGIWNGTLELGPDEGCPPTLLSFARLLLEIEKGEALPVTSVHYSNRDLREQLSYIVEDELQGQLTSLYREAIKGCLDFNKILSAAQGTTSEMQVRHVIHNIVENLRQQYHLYLWSNSPHENRGLQFPSGPPRVERQTSVITTSTFILFDDDVIRESTEENRLVLQSTLPLNHIIAAANDSK